MSSVFINTKFLPICVWCDSSWHQISQGLVWGLPQQETHLETWANEGVGDTKAKIILVIIIIYTLIKRRNYVNIFYCAARAPDMLHDKQLHEKMCFQFWFKNMYLKMMISWFLMVIHSTVWGLHKQMLDLLALFLFYVMGSAVVEYLGNCAGCECVGAIWAFQVLSRGLRC